MWEFGNASKNQGVRRRGVGLSASYRGAGESLASQAMRGAQGAGFDTSKNGGAGSLRSPAHANAVRGGSHRSTFSGSTAMHAGSVSGKMFGRSSNRYGRYSSAQRSGLDAVKITSSAWSDIAKVDDLLAYKSSFDRTCWCLKLGVLRRSNRQRPTESVTTNAWLNRWEDYCEVPLFLISLTIILMLASSLPPTIIYISLKVTAKYFGTRQHDQTRDIDGTDVHDALPLIEDEHEESNWMSTLLTLSVAGLAVLIVLLARLPWFTLRRAVFSRVVNLFRATVYPKALLASACTTIASIVLHYAFANAAGVGRGVPGGRGGTGDHLWGQMIYQCSLWEDDSYVLGFNGAQSSAPITHDICVNSAQLTSFITALMGGWIATAYFVWTEQYVLWFPVVHRPRIMQLFPRVAQSVYVAARLGAYSFLASILCVHVLPSRGLRLSVVEFVLVSLYGTANVEGAKGIIDTAHPGLAALWDQSTLASCMMCWGNSILVHFTMLAAHHILSVIITDAAFTHVSENLLQWSDLLVGASVRGRYRLAQRSSWDVDLLVDSKQSSLSVVRNELRRRQAIAMRHFGTNVDIHTILSVGNRPLPHAPALFNSDTVMAPLGAYGQEAESSSDDGIEALIMALAIARPGSIHEKFVTWVPRARRSVNVEKIQEPMHGQSSSSSCDQLSSCFSVLRWFCCFNCCCPCFCCGRPSSPSRSSSSVSRRPGSGPSILGSGGVSSNKTSSLGLPKLSHEYMSAGSTLQVGDSLSGARNDALNFKASAREYEGIRSTVPPKRVLQKVSERRFYDVLQNHAKIYGDSVFTLGLTEEERDQRYRYNTAYWRAERKLSLRDEISRASSILHLRSVANFDEKKLIRLINSNRGNHWVEVVRLCTAKIDALTLSLQIMSGSKIIVASPYGDEGNSMGGDNFGSLWSAIKSTTGAATNPEPLALGMHPGRVVGGYERMSTNTSRAYIWDRASRHRSRKLWRLWFWPRCLRGFRWWHFEFSEMMPVYAAARTREKLNSSYADLAVWALQEVNKQYDEHPWVNWPQDANSKLEEAYQTEMQQVEVTIASRDIFSSYEVWRQSRAVTMQDDDDSNDLDDPNEVLTFLVDLRDTSAREGEFFMATLVKQQNSEGIVPQVPGASLRTFRVLRKPRDHNGKQSRDLRGSGTGDQATVHGLDPLEKNSRHGCCDCSAGESKLLGSVFFRTPQQETQALFADAQLDIWTIEAVSTACCRAARIIQVHKAALISTVPTLLCSLLGCLISIEEYVKSPAFLGQKTSPPELHGHQLVRPQPKALGFVLERAIYGLVTSFYELLETFDFPPEYGSLLARFAGFQHA